MAVNDNDDRLFTPTEITEYLARIQLKQEDLQHLSQSDSLKELHVSHILNVPFDTTAVHLPREWWIPSSDSTHPSNVNLDYKTNSIQPELISVQSDNVFKNIIKEKRGGYCWSLNSCFARLLVSLGYKVSQLPARVFAHRNQDPAVMGYSWTPLCHECLLVETDSGKFICDVGFGGGSSAFPIPFEENRPIETLTAGEKFRLLREKCIELDHSSVGQAEGYTVQRWCGKWWSPCYHLYLSPFVFKDIETFSWFNSVHPEAFSKTRLIVTLLRKDGSRRSLTCSIDENGKQTAIKLVTRESVNAEETHVSIVNPTYSELFQTLKHEFRWGPT